MANVGLINATLTAVARTEIERFLVNARAPGAVPSLFKKADEGEASQWSYGVFTLDRVRSLESAMQSHGQPLRYEIDGVMFAISNSKHARELDGKVLDYGGPGYLVARAAAPH
jgi:hypothetical protein